ncbi:hypothetical protein MRB53_038503 [Persea americana]|nr:hypothetical protein MRB53_038503 [Persea americana]
MMGIANRALGLPLERAANIAPERDEAVDETIPRKGNDALRVQQPGAPFFSSDGDARRPLDERLGEREGGGEADGDCQGLVVDLLCCRHFAGAVVRFNHEGVVGGGVLLGGPGRYCVLERRR